LPALLSAPLVFLALFAGKVGTKIFGLYPVIGAFRQERNERWYYTLMMSTGLTFGTISALFGLNHHIINQTQYSHLVATVIGSAVIPTDDNVYIGDFNRNATVTCRYKVAISSDAENQTYPVDVAVSYENRDGDMVTSASDTIGVPVLGKLTFAVISEPMSVTPGSENVIAVQYRNTGTQTAYHAQARLSVVDPFTSSDNGAYLGDLKPGDTATAHFQVSTDSAATAQDNALDTDVRYRDALDNSQISDTFKVDIRVAPSSQPGGIAAFLPVILLAVIAIGAGYYLLVMRKKK